MVAVVAISLMVSSGVAKAAPNTFSYTDTSYKVIQDGQGQQYSLIGLFCGFGKDVNGSIVNSLTASTAADSGSPILGHPYCLAKAQDGSDVRIAADAFWANASSSVYISIDGDIGAAERPPVSASSGLSGSIAKLHTFSSGIQTSENPIVIEPSTLSAGLAAGNDGRPAYGRQQEAQP